MTQYKSQLNLAFSALLALALMATGCTKKRDAALSDGDALQTFAIEEFSTPTGQGYSAGSKASLHQSSDKISTNLAFREKGLITLDIENSNIPERLKFMFTELEIGGVEGQDYKIVFGVDSKYVTAYKLTSQIDKLSQIEKQLAVSPNEVQLSIQLQKATDRTSKNSLTEKIASEQKLRTTSLANQASINVLVPIFKYEILAKGVLERVKNELRESTSTLTLRETEFSEATHIKIKTSSEDRKDIGSLEQKAELDQLYTTDSLDNKVSTSKDLQTQFNFHMRFVPDNSKVLTKLDATDLKVFEVTSLTKLSQDEQRLIKTNRANGEILRCSESQNHELTSAKDNTCVLRLVGKVPVAYKNVSLTLADERDNTTNSLLIQTVPKSSAHVLVEIAPQTQAERARPTGIIDPLRTIKISDLAGEFYFRRTFEDASNMMTIGKTGTSGDMSVVKFEFENDRIVVRNQKALIQYIGQGPKDKEELMSVPVKYFALDTTDASGVALQIPVLRQTDKDSAEYIEIDWTANTVPIANSPLAFFDAGQCWTAETSQHVTDMDMRLSRDGILNFSMSGSYTVRPECANQDAISDKAQMNYNVVERLSFKKRTQAAVDDMQFAPNISLKAQSAMNFAIFTMSDQSTNSNVMPGRENSVINHPIIHDFRNGKVLNYWIGGLANSSKDRRALIEQAAKEVIAEWNEALHKAFQGDSTLDRTGDYIKLNIEEEDNRGHLGDLDKNYLWFMDMPAENGLLGVAQFAPNPYSGTIIANNVIVYSGNSETEVRSFLASYKESLEYENILKEAKDRALAEFKKQEAIPEKTSSANSANGEKLTSTTKDYDTYLKKIILSARPLSTQRLTSKYAGLMNQSRFGNININSLKNQDFLKRNVVSESAAHSNKAFTRRVLEQALAGEFKNDPMMLEAIIARELARTETGLSPQIKAVLIQQARMKEMSGKFDRAASKRGGCFLYSRADYNNKFLQTDFNTLFKTQIKATLLHEVGHALGLRHNFKGSYDKQNFSFAGENNNRNYSSIMDYIASPEMEYAGPGPYDVHALRAIYTQRVELNDEIKKVAAKSNGSIKALSKNITVGVIDGKYLRLEDIKKFYGLTYWSHILKGSVDKSHLLKHYAQCHDELIGVEAACQPYDQGSTASEIVSNEIQNYHRLYATSYHASDRINFGWPQKIAVIRRAIEKFENIRGYLDQFFKLIIFDNAQSTQELKDFLQATYLGYDFFHEVIRIPDTDLPFGKSPVEISKRLIPVKYISKSPVLNADGSQEMDSSGHPKFVESTEIKILEARPVNDKALSNGDDRLDTLGIGYDKQFAIEFLLTPTPAAMTVDSEGGWFSYNEFEKYVLGVKNSFDSLNMLTLLDIMKSDLQSGFVDKNHNIQSTGQNINISKSLLDSAIIGGLADTNLVSEKGFDSFAEFLKVGTLKGGKTLQDRVTVGRYGQDAKSSVGVRFYPSDNAVGANELIKLAARKNFFSENKVEIKKAISDLLAADVASNQKVIEIRAKNPQMSNKSVTEILASSKELQKFTDAGNHASGSLVKLLNHLNRNEDFVTKEEITANPNLAIDKQVLMLRGMMLKSLGALSALKTIVEKVPQEQWNEQYKQFAELKAHNSDLAKLELLGLGQEVFSESASEIKISIKNVGTINGAEFVGVFMDKDAFSNSQINLMYVIEQLAKYSSALNPEYVY